MWQSCWADSCKERQVCHSQIGGLIPNSVVHFAHILDSIGASTFGFVIMGQWGTSDIPSLNFEILGNLQSETLAMTQCDGVSDLQVIE